MKPLPYPQTFPFCDLLISELENPQPYERAEDVCNTLSISLHNLTTKAPCGVFDGLRNSRVQGTKITTRSGQTREIRVQRSSGLSQFTYQPVVSRTFIGYRPSPKSAPEKILFWVKELLGCGHKQAMFPVPGETFTARKRHCGECAKEAVHAIEGKKPVERVLQPKRKQTGNSVWPLVWAFVLVVAAILWFRAHQAISYTYNESFRVLAQINPQTFIMQRIGQPPVKLRFCNDYLPKFEPGMTLTWFSYEDRGSCVSIAPANRGYVILRGSDHWPIIPNNCVNPAADKPIVCDGPPNFEGESNVRSK